MPISSVRKHFGVRTDPHSPPHRSGEPLQSDTGQRPHIMMAAPLEGAGLIMSANASADIRRAKLADAQAIADIYNEAILSTMATFDTEPKSLTERTRWLQSHDDRHPVLVAIVMAKSSAGRPLHGGRSDGRTMIPARPHSMFIRRTGAEASVGSLRKQSSKKRADSTTIHSLRVWPRATTRTFISTRAWDMSTSAPSKKTDESSTGFWMSTLCRKCWTE